MSLWFKSGRESFNLAKKDTKRIIQDIKDNDYIINDELFDVYSKNFNKAIDAVFSDGENPELSSEFRANINRFSAYKTAKEVAAIRKTSSDDGAESVVNAFNRYQTAEYNTTVTRARTAKQFDEFSKSDAPNIMWLPSRSVELREEHIPFYNKIWAKDDVFWTKNLPGTLWNCKCDWAETYRDVTNNQGLGNNDVSNQGLKGNPALTGEIFSNDHNYFKGWSDEDRNFNNHFPAFRNDKKITSIEDVSRVVSRCKYLFKNGFKEVKFAFINGNGSTDKAGTINLTPKTRDLCIQALDNINNNKDNTQEQDEALFSLWHEITHNRHNGTESAGDYYFNRRFMELANEFVARKTFTWFYNNILGGNFKNTDLLKTRNNNQKYSLWVERFQQAINEHCKGKEKQVYDYVFNWLVNKPYDNQFQGLVNALEIYSNLTNDEAFNIVKCFCDK